MTLFALSQTNMPAKHDLEEAFPHMVFSLSTPDLSKSQMISCSDYVEISSDDDSDYDDCSIMLDSPLLHSVSLGSSMYKGAFLPASHEVCTQHEP